MPILDAFIRSLVYDPARLLAVQEDGTSRGEPARIRTEAGNAVIVCTRRENTLRRNLSDVALLAPSTGVVYPGALVLVNQDLRDGKPTPVALKRAPVTISIDLPGLNPAHATVGDPTSSNVQDAITGLLERWSKEPASEGYINAARSFLNVTTAYTSRQAALDLGFNADWAGGQASLNLNVSSNSERSVLQAYFKQVFYSVTMDTPPSPGSVFAPTVTEEEAVHALGRDNPPGYVRTVDYGRVLLISMETTSKNSSIDLQAAFKHATAGAELGGHVDARYSKVIENSKFTVVAIGGGAEVAKSFVGSDDIKRLRQYIEDGARYRRDNPGRPISYSVAFLKDHALATLGFATDYTETEYRSFSNGFVRFDHDGAYVAKFKVTWREADKNGNYTVEKKWASGEEAIGFTHQIDLPGDAQNVRILAQVKTGWIGQPWRDILNEYLDGPTNETYRVYGVVSTTKWQTTK